ncbi:Phytosylfokine-alpha receptor [Heracleum sosnowskyi]|uniref:Phytosylfokine-alpha receptor n=1 Tax=Heracleum sosnowskyi TaxID=360622 RepID=A0AAD8IKH7_9APIA|nr:Phytosylfokine-alpha receptor [Heracleum sosnowskyi]
MLLKNRSSWHQLEISFFLCLCFLAKAAASNNASCNVQDLTALLGFLDDLESGIGGWGIDSDADCCAWDGVTCEFVSKVPNISRVVSLELPHKKLKGKLNKSLAGLVYFRVLNLSNNFFSDNLPRELFRFEFLEVLDLSSNNLEGNLSMEISLPSLKFLDLSHNLLEGFFNMDICGVASRLQVLDLSMNSFTDKIPPTIGKCSFLEVLSLGSNFFNGSLPEELFQLPMLRQLTVQHNGFTGLLSPAIGKLSNIVKFDISENGFSGTLPDAFYSLQKLKIFSANSNRFIGSLPPSLSSSPSIFSLNTRNNSLNGSIALNCSSMVSLSSLALSSNSFSGPFPENLPSCKNLTSLNLSRNKFSSQLPESYKSFASLSQLSLSNCSLQNLTATLEILQHCKNLRFLILTLNFHNEVMPTDNHLQFNSLETLIIANCPLTGSIPNWLQSCANLQFLDLSWNLLKGHIPNFFSEMRLLFYLDLSRNMLSEEIPEGLAKLKSLSDQNVTYKKHSQDLNPLTYRTTTRTLQYTHIQGFPPSLDLSSNYLTGSIPAEFGTLKQLHVLNLYNNSLSGNIPETLSDITSLEILDLSNNSLTGTMPPTLAKLSFLSKFSVAFNKLSGNIPTGGQFTTFPSSSFEGNDDLSGYESSLDPSESKGKTRKNLAGTGDGEDSIIGLPFVIGSIIAFVIVVTIGHLSGWLFPKEKANKRIEIAWRRIR